jgi:hypothetical protein
VDEIKKLLRAILSKFKSLLDEKKILDQIRENIQRDIRQVMFGEDSGGSEVGAAPAAAADSRGDCVMGVAHGVWRLTGKCCGGADGSDWSEDAPFILKPQNFSISLSQVRGSLGTTLRSLTCFIHVTDCERPFGTHTGWRLADESARGCGSGADAVGNWNGGWMTRALKGLI